VIAPPRKPLWPESGQLFPQHFQFGDRYVEELLACRLDAVAPYAWGFSDLVVSADALAKGVLRVSRLTARFPSGQTVFVTNGDAPLERLMPPPPPGSASVAVDLGLALSSDEAPNVAEDLETDAAVRHGRMKASDGERCFLIPRLRLLCDGEGDDRYERMALARVLSRSGRLELDPDLLPPMLRVLDGTFLAEALNTLVDALLGRQAELLEVRNARPLDLVNFHPSHGPQLLLLSAINQALAVLRDPAFSRELTPRTLHAALTELLGALDGLVTPPERAAILPYAHEAPGPNFRSVIDRLLALVPEVAKDPALVFPLQRVNASTFSLKIEDGSVFRRRVYLVAASEDLSVPAQLAAHAKIASGSTLSSIVQSAIRGVALAAEFDPPPFLPSKATYACFRLDTRGQYWADVLEQRSLLMHVPSAPADLTISLYVLTTDR
jgi:type VI secretion system protein ImpJ